MYLSKVIAGITNTFDSKGLNSMNRTIINRLMCGLILVTYNFTIHTLNVVPLVMPRSQSSQTNLELNQLTHYLNHYDTQEYYSDFATTVGYSRSFRPHQLWQSMFGTDFTSECAIPAIGITGSQVALRRPNNWLADNFYLPAHYRSLISFKPVNENVFIYFNAFFALNTWMEGLFLKIHAPFVWNRTSLNILELKLSSSSDQAAGYFTPDIIPAADLLQNFISYAQGQSITNQQGVIFQGLKYAKIAPCNRVKTGLSDLQAIIGYNVLSCPDYHLGAGLFIAAPTGNAPDGQYLFEPIVGNGKHWELGAHVTGHYTFWHHEPTDINLAFYIDANITHLFASRQKRFFDLKCKPLSRYMLAERVDQTNTANLQGDGLLPHTVFNNEFNPVANLTAQCVNVWVKVQADIVAQITCRVGNWDWDVGYNAWFRSCENIQPTCSTPFEQNTWALKGDAYVFGFASAPDGAPPTLQQDQPVGLSGTESKATIYSGTNFVATNIGVNNLGVDHAQLATAGGSDTPLNNTLGSVPIYTSIQPKFLAASDIDYIGTKSISQKIYMNFGYNWDTCQQWTPYLGMGFSGEFGHTSNEASSVNNKYNNRCISCALSQWSLWTKFSLSFN